MDERRASSDFIGRAEELGRLLADAPMSSWNSGSLHVVSGPAGIGKSSLVARLIRQSGIAAGVGRPLVGLESPPLWPWFQALRSISGQTPDAQELVQLVALLDDSSATGSQRPELLLTVAELLCTVADDLPMLVVLDDLHRADAQTLAVVDLLLDVDRLPLKLVCVFRTTGDPADGRPPAMDRWLARRGVRSIELGPLPEADVVRLIDRHFEGSTGLSASAIATLAGGNPLLALELGRASGPLPRGHDLELVQLIERRVAPLDRDGVLAALGLLGRASSPTLLAQITGRPVALVGEVLRAATWAQVLSWTGDLADPAGFAHELFGTAITHRLDASERDAVHRRIYEVLAGQESVDRHSLVAVEAARHAIAGGVSDESVVALCGRAARRSELVGDLEGAASLLGHALDAPAGPVVRRPVIQAYARVLARLGRFDEAAPWFEEAMFWADQLGDREGFAEVVCDLGEHDPRLTVPGLERAVTTLDALGRLGADRPDLRARLHRCRAEALAGTDFDACEVELSRAVHAARRSGDPDTLAVVLRQVPLALRHEPGGDRFRRVSDELHALPGRAALLSAVMTDASRALVRGARAELDDLVLRLEHALPPSAPAESVRALAGLRMSAALFDGDEPQVERRLGELLEVSAGPAAGGALASFPAQLVWRVLTGRYLTVDVANPSAWAASGHAFDLVIFGHTFLDARAGDAPALDRIRSFLRPPSTLPLDSSWTLWTSLLAICASMVADRAVCHEAVDALFPGVEEFVTLGPHTAIAPVGWVIAEPLAGLGRRDEAQEAALLGLEAARRMDAPLWVMRCLIQLVGLSPQAPPRALAAWVDEARELAGRFGVSLSESGARGIDQREHEAELRETRILALASQGRSNREIAEELNLSVKSVERIFSVIFRRTGARNRAEAVARYLGSVGHLVERAPGAPGAPGPVTGTGPRPEVAPRPAARRVAATGATRR